jgi:hypothetical protein
VNKDASRDELKEADDQDTEKSKKKHKKKSSSKKTKLVNTLPFHGLANGLKPHLTFNPLDESSIPEAWKVVDGTFVYFVGSNISHISNDFLSNPYAHMADGTVDVAYCNDINSKMKMLSVMAAEMESGKYVRHDFINYVKATALALIPTGKPGIMVRSFTSFHSSNFDVRFSTSHVWWCGGVVHPCRTLMASRFRESQR